MLMVGKKFSHENQYFSKLQKFSPTKKTHCTVSALLCIEVFGKLICACHAQFGMHCLWSITCTVHFFYEVLNKREITKVHIVLSLTFFLSSLHLLPPPHQTFIPFRFILFSLFPVSPSPSCPCPFLSLAYRVI